ncbi:hypothetical protein BCR43DRAFT_565779 [Syncephalastrum racemosum]|uniref:Uncharacterized protein n=1 Tax=Syncephalastrum racemosum TaxID=13706 RepID=A0A1X2H414_SYNRA|nr:hypothetical protein BCR43DRAFT_565779 [Syncephalastrum racemosum]
MVEAAHFREEFFYRKSDWSNKKGDPSLRKLCLKTVDEVCEKKLKEIISKTKPDERLGLKEVLLTRPKIPRGIFTETARLLKARMHPALLDKITLNGSWVRIFTGYELTHWRKLVDARFDQFYQHALKTPEEENEWMEIQRRKEKEHKRVFANTIPVKTLLRNDLQRQEVFLEVLGEIQLHISKDMSELSDAIRKIILHFAAKGLSCYNEQDQQHTSTELPIPVTTTTATATATAAAVPFCPLAFIPRKQQIRAPSPIPHSIRPLDGQRQRILELIQSSRAHRDFLSPVHCLHIYRRLFLTHKKKGTTPLQKEWDQIIQGLTLPEHKRALVRRVRTAEVAVIELSARCGEQWRKGNIFKQSLDSLCLILLQLHLSPDAEEQTYRANLLKKDDRLPSRGVEDDDGNPTHKRRDKSRRATKGPAESAVHTAPRHRKSKKSLKSIQDNQEDNLVEISNGGSKTSVHSFGVVHYSDNKDQHGSYDDRVTANEAGSIDDGIMWHQKQQRHQQVSETTQCRISVLKECLKTLVLAEDIDGPVTPDNIARIMPPLEICTKPEIDALCQLSNTLRPYSPRKTDIFHPLLTIPFVVLANTILKMAGYPQYVREISPSICADQYHPITLKWYSLYEIFCKRTFDLYSVQSDNGAKARSLSSAKDMEEELFYAFFDHDQIRKIGESSFGAIGEFRKRIVVDSKQNATLEYLIPAPVSKRRQKRR